LLPHRMLEVDQARVPYPQIAFADVVTHRQLRRTDGAVLSPVHTETLVELVAIAGAEHIGVAGGNRPYVNVMSRHHVDQFTVELAAETEWVRSQRTLRIDRAAVGGEWAASLRGNGARQCLQIAGRANRVQEIMQEGDVAPVVEFDFITGLNAAHHIRRAFGRSGQAVESAVDKQVAA